MSYELVGWENKPSTKTAVGATNLKHMDNGIKDAHDFIDSLPEWLKEGGKPDYTAEEVGAYSKEQTVQLLYTKANAIITEQSGETILTTDSANAPLVDMTPYGKSKQNQYEGNQLAIPSADKISSNVSGATSITINGDIINITATEDAVDRTHTFMFKLSRHSLEVGKSYTILLYDKNDNLIGGNDDYWKVFFRDSMINTITVTEDMLTSSNYGMYYIQARNKNSVKKGTYQYKIMVCESSKLTDTYEPYVGNKPSPSIDYPQQIESHGDKGRIDYGVYGRNLCPPITQTFVNSGITYDFSDGYVHITGTANALANTNSRVDILLPTFAGKYTIPPKQNNVEIAVCIRQADDTKLYKDKTYTIDGTEQYVNMYFQIKSGLTVDETIPLICNYGTELLPYEPYTKQPLTLLTPNGLRGIPIGTTIPDAIKNSEIHMRGVYWDEEDGQYYISDTVDMNRGKYVQRIFHGKPNKVLVFKSDTNGRYMCNNWGYFAEENVTALSDSIGGRSLCTHAIWSSWGNGANGTFSFTSNSIYYKDSTKTLAEINAMFAEIGTDIEFACILKNPTNLYLLPDELKQYKSLMMNKPNTTILNDANAYTDVEYVADTKIYIDNKFKELEANVTSAVAQLL